MLFLYKHWKLLCTGLFDYIYRKKSNTLSIKNICNLLLKLKSLKLIRFIEDKRVFYRIVSDLSVSKNISNILLSILNNT